MEQLQDLYREAKRRLDRVDFGKLWPGFHLFRFALYTEDAVCLDGALFPRSGAFRGNTAIRLEGGWTAIWNVAGVAPDPDLLAADLVHEMFHAFQMEQGETRYPDDLAALEYPLSAANLSRKLAENRLLCQSLQAADRGERLRLLSSFRALREARRVDLGPALNQELLPETVEGMAEYMGLRALACLSEEKHRLRLEHMLRSLEAAEPLLDVRRVSYCTGAALLLAAKAAGMPISHSLTETRPVYDIVCANLPINAAPAVPTDRTLDALIAAQTAERRETLSRFFRTAAPPVSGQFEIQGYDPMNMFQVGQLLYGSHFWLLLDRESGQAVELEAAVLLRSSGRRAERYWRAR